jgi:hypothetical protein
MSENGAPAATPGAGRALQRKTYFLDGTGVCELAHTRAAKNLRPFRQSSEGMQMLAWTMGVVVVIGLMWSTATMCDLVPVVLDSAPVSRPAG